MQTVTIEEAQAKLPKLVEDLALSGEILIVRHGKSVARLVAASAEVPVPKFGSARGLLIIHSEDDEHLKDFKDYMP